MNTRLKRLVLTGIFTALIFVFAAFIHIPSYTGYVHIGDGFIYIVATLLPVPYAAFAAAAGAVLSDVLTGYAIWASASLVIKAVTVLFFTWRSQKILCKRNFLALIPSAVLCVGGYYIYEIILYGNAFTPLYGMDRKRDSVGFQQCGIYTSLTRCLKSRNKRAPFK